MNRRKFLEALAGIPLLGLLVKLPKAKQAGEINLGVAEDASDGISVRWTDGHIYGEETACYSFVEPSFIELGPKEIGPYIRLDKTGLHMFDSNDVETYHVSRDGTIA